jgi:hypothetical protein
MNGACCTEQIILKRCYIGGGGHDKNAGVGVSLGKAADAARLA